MIASIVLIISLLIIFSISAVIIRAIIKKLSSSPHHKVQTGGIYSFSRHPFYLGFLFILFSSCLFTLNYINIAAFLGAWLIHHVIMIREEQFLESLYGDEYTRYAKKVNLYITWRHNQEKPS
ncbi:MAG: isoprenylcysteine carboxylmethyltransferase family protein [Bacteroidota bacterium]